jgi:hypothetical protein
LTRMKLPAPSRVLDLFEIALDRSPNHVFQVVGFEA